MAERPAEPLVSVVVPVFEVAGYLATCVESILGQTHPYLEVILVDDGSTDGSSELCDSFARRDGRVRVIHQRHEGVSVARNAGIAAATGTHLTFVDSDDWIAPTFVARLLSLLRERDADAAVCHYTRVPDGAVPSTAPPFPGEPAIRVLEPDETLLAFLGPDYPTMTVAWGKLLHRDLLAGIEFPADVRHEDDFVTYRILHRAHRTVVTSERLYSYRQRASSFMAREFDVASRLHRLEAYRERAEYFQLAGLGNVAYRQLLDEQLALRQHMADLGDEESRRRFDRDLVSTVRTLRTTRQPVLFRALTEAYLVSPCYADKVYRWVMRLRR